MKFNNDLRRLERAYQRAWLAVQTIADILPKSPKLVDAATLRLTHLQETVSGYVDGGHWYCDKCGQTRFVQPERDEQCDFCKSTTWKVAIATK